MTATSVAHVTQRLWRGYDDPGLPVGMYFAQGAVTGDATGGQARIQFQFREAGSGSSRFWNIEQLEAFHSVETSRNFAMIATNWDVVSDVGLINRQWRAVLQDNSNGVAASSTDAQFPLPIFLGRTAPVEEIASNIEMSCDNTDLSSFVVTMQGYIWEPRSILAEGGLRRPIDSLYGGGGR